MIKYEEITIPEELYFYMNEFDYGYLTKNKNVIVEEKPTCDEFWYNNYILQDTEDLTNSKTGNCYDQTEFARTWFEKHNYKVITIHEKVSNHINFSHSFIVYYDEESNTYNWFETTWKKHGGIKKYKNLKSLIEHQYMLYSKELRKNGIYDKSNIELTNFTKPKSHSTVREYLTNINKGKKIVLKKVR